MTRAATDMELVDLIARLQLKFGMDLSSYRLNCLKRRISLRMSTLRIDGVDGYFAYISSNRGEIEALLDTITIHVTEFFRDADVFEDIARDVLPGIVERARGGSGSSLRVWSAGCSTGEEAYSLAIVILDYLRSHRIDIGLDLQATDISKEACRVGRLGIYDRSKIEHVPAALRDRCFEPVPEGFRVAEAVRRAVHFAVHDLFQGAPYERLDMIVCRNVLIHFDHIARDEVVRRFHGALGPGGILVLGKTEAITGSAGALFDLVDPRSKLYRSVCSVFPEGGKR